MTAESSSIPAEALLQHRGFVSALARSLTRDEHAAEDLAQETWLEALRRPPRSAGALRGWLARVTTSRARNAARGERRRAVREHSAARAELDESEEHTRERVMLQQRVVEAVLALPEPYRTVVLLRYDQDLDPSEIAEKRGVPPGTIRSQLSRAHALLREKLDSEFEGHRAAWLVPLATLAAPRGAAITAGKVAVATAGAVVLAATYAVLVEAHQISSGIIHPTEQYGNTETASSEASPVLDAFDPSPSSRQPVEQRAGGTVSSNPGESDLAKMELAQLQVLGQQVQRALRDRLLVPDLKAPEVAEILARVPDAQVARLLPFGRIEDDIDGRFLGISGGGAYWSFATKSNDYDREPDLTLSGFNFSARGYGGTAGWIHDLGRIDLAGVRSDPLSPPLRDERTREVWNLSWQDAHVARRDFDRSIEVQARELELPQDAPAALGHVYLLRRILPGEHDLLAVFSAIARDDYGYTIAGRVLHRWPLPEGSERGAGPTRYPDVKLPDDPDWLKAMDVEALLELSHRIRAAGEAKLFALPDALSRRFPDASGLDDRGFARLLHRFRYDAVTAVRDGGSFFTFLTRSSAFDGSNDLHFEQDRLLTVGRGALIDLGPVNFDSIERYGSTSSAELSASTREACELLSNARHAPASVDKREPRVFMGDDDQRIQDLNRAQYGPRAVTGHTYLLRSLVRDDHDVLVAFAVVDSDEHGIWIRWRILRSWPM